MRLRYFLLLLGVPPWLTLAAQELPRVELSAGMHRIDAEVVNTQESRMHGLMMRKAMPAQHGMLFVFDADARHCMWMKNTLMPLSVAFIDEAGRIVNVEEMKPQTEDTHCAAKPARYALEMNANWFASRGLKPGTALKGIDRAPPPR
jgi:uncharacterized membrane protein (UPF0127 family)